MVTCGYIITGLTGTLAVITALFWILVALDTVTGLRKVKILRSRPGNRTGHFPRVSIIVTAKDEEAAIAHSLRTIRGLDYPDFEVIVVDDRSTDGTGAEIESVRKEWAGLKVMTIGELPDGWIGKTHACYCGYRMATGEILLFTDADVRFEPDALRTAVAYLQTQPADHLAVSPAIYGDSFPVRLFVRYFLFSFLIYFRPWAGGIGVGAFNMFRREAYERVGTHRAIALRPDEDLQIGKRVKKSGSRQRFAGGKYLMSVRWYASLRETMRGIEKNAFAGLHYSWAVALSAVTGQVLLFVYPFIAVLVMSGWTQAVYGAVLAIMFCIYLYQTKVFSRSSGADVVLLPLSALLFIFIVCRALALTLLRGGIQWRGTFYSLDDLRTMRHL
jgi:cellulose synthase/poly-beta-1,6-N-acetylglucosamine synthase-like glycosyltransferase